jgi:hypothetical protein
MFDLVETQAKDIHTYKHTYTHWQMRAEDLVEMEATVTARASQDSDVDGVCLWFDCDFEMGGGTEPVHLLTGPGERETHWKQTVVLLGGAAKVRAEEEMPFTVKLKQDSDNIRRYLLSVST